MTSAHHCRLTCGRTPCTAPMGRNPPGSLRLRRPRHTPSFRGMRGQGHRLASVGPQTLCGRRELPSALHQPWNVTLADNSVHRVKFTFGHPPFDMLLQPSVYDQTSWERLLREQEYAYHVAALRRVIRRFASGGQCTVLDIGCNSGYISLLSASFGCRVHAFEASPAMQRHAQRSFDANGEIGRRVNLHRIAVARQEGNLNFVTLRGGSIYDHIVSAAEARTLSALPDHRVTRVPARPISIELAKSGPADSFDFAKLDCEGCEAMALVTLRPLLVRGAIRVIMTEWITKRIQAVSGKNMIENAVGILRSAGYRSLTWSGHPQPLDTLLDPKTEVGDLFIVHGDISVAEFTEQDFSARSHGILATWQELQQCEQTQGGRRRIHSTQNHNKRK